MNSFAIKIEEDRHPVNSPQIVIVDSPIFLIILTSSPNEKKVNEKEITVIKQPEKSITYQKGCLMISLKLLITNEKSFPMRFSINVPCGTLFNNVVLI
ncbi:MAG: hypothetical protein ACYSR0_06010 [Planctomycetota bacterium]